MNAAVVVSKELGIPRKYIKTTSRKDRIITVVHRFWLKSLLRTHQLSDFIYHDSLNVDEIEVALHQADDLGPLWQKLFVRVFEKKEENVFPLPRMKIEHDKSDAHLSYAQILHYISQTNHKNVWKDIYRKHQSIHRDDDTTDTDNKQSNVPFVNYTLVLEEMICRTYGCPIISVPDESSGSSTLDKKYKICDVHSNILPALCAVEKKNFIFLIMQPFINHALQDCVTFSPAMLGTSHMKPLFIIYQMLQATKCLHDRGLVLGDITLSDVLVTDNLWIKVIPQLVCNINIGETRASKMPDKSNETKNAETEKYKISEAQSHSCIQATNDDPQTQIASKQNCEYVQSSSDPKHLVSSRITDFLKWPLLNNLDYLCELWVKGTLSNFKYLLALNHLAGRRYGDPTCHFVMPWVTDFTVCSGEKWRDLTRSKYRLNKGDRQLDLTFDTASSTAQVPHHVSDVLSEITYYVYMARRTPRSVLCKYIRSKWVPAEYPSSIQRLQEWTPDECIPEFFIDPSVFESIHEDLPNLEVPLWASSTEDFIEKHKEALESAHVSERLHHWIDLTFGYKLSGSAAIKSKNVCLQLVDSHTSLRNTGVVQLFTQPHPQKLGVSPYWGITAPILHPVHKERRRDRSNDDDGQSSGIEDDDQSTASQNHSRSSPLAISRLSRSRGSLLTPFYASEETGFKDRSDHTKLSSINSLNGNSVILLPRDYNPVAALQNVESLYGFLGRTFHHKVPQIAKREECKREGSSKDSAINHQLRDMQVLGCLVVELLLASKLRAFGCHTSLSFEKRLSACTSVLSCSGDALPHCVRHTVALLLQINLSCGISNVAGESYRCTQDKNLHCAQYPIITEQGLPPPSAHQLLQPVMSSVLFPFPRHFPNLYTFLQKFHDYTCITRELRFLHRIDVNAGKDVNSETAEKISLFASKVGELKVKTAYDELSVLLPEMQSSLAENLDLILPYVKELLQDSTTSVSAAWCLFDPVARVLGPQKTTVVLLESIVKLYEYGAEDTTVSSSSNKHVKLYHRSFLLQLIVRLGLKTFLDNFVTPLVEAVGGYRDILSTENGLSQRRVELRNKPSNLKSCELEETRPVGTLSPLDEDSSGDSEQQKLGSEGDDENDGDDDDNDDETSEGKKLLEQDRYEEMEPEMFVFETEEIGRQSPSGENVTPLYNLMDHFDLNLPQPLGDGEDNASLELPGEQHDEVDGDEEVIEADGEREHESKDLEQNSNAGEISDVIPDENMLAKEQKEERTKKPMGHYKVSDMSADSVLWLSHRLGPVLTSRHLSRNLLRMLTLCFLGKDNLSLFSNNSPSGTLDNSETLNISNGMIVGDKNAAKVLECLTSIAGLYGEQLIVLQYLPHMGELIALCKRKLTANLEGGLVGCLALLRHLIPYLCDATLMDQLQDVIVKNILNPAVRLVSTTRFTFPSGTLARAAVTIKFVDALYVISLRIGCEMTRKNLSVPALQRFFLAFDKAHGNKRSDDVGLVPPSVDGKKESPLCISKSLEDSSYLEIRRDGTLTEWTIKGMPLQISHVRVRDSDSADSYSPPLGTSSDSEQIQDQTRSQAVDELKYAFTPELAHKSYVAFLRFLGEAVMEQSLKNENFIKDLCFEYEKQRHQSCGVGGPVNVQYLSDYLTATNQIDTDRGTSGSFGSNVSLVGNRIDLQRVDIPSVVPPASSAEHIMTLISKKMENTKRHLHGNWLAYWEHEIGRAEKDIRFNFKQIKLQTFSGHSNGVRTIQALDNENSFISGSRDKTVKLWSLRSEGDGSSVSHCQWTYTGHRKSVMAISFLESLRLAASCDSVVHIWDPFIGCVVSQLDMSRSPPINVLKAMPPPSTSLLASTTEATLRILDGRTCSFVNELKVSMNPAGLIRCIAVGPDGHWVAVGQSSGTLTILDIRTGMIMSSWKGHEGEVLQLVAVNNDTLISSSLDQAVSVWNTVDGRFNFHMKGPTEPVHCMNCYNTELISGTTASRIGVHTAVDAEASFSSTRLRSDAFKGVLTTMAVLPLNRLLLLGSDNGNITLLC